MDAVEYSRQEMNAVPRTLPPVNFGKLGDSLAHLVGDDVGLGEIARCLETMAQLIVEAQVDVDLLIRRAVEGPHGRLGHATGGTHRVSKQYQPRLLVGKSFLLEEGCPGFFDIRQNNGNELHLFLLLRRLMKRRA